MIYHFRKRKKCESSNGLVGQKVVRPPPLTQLPNGLCVGPLVPWGGGGLPVFRGFKGDGLSGYSQWEGVGGEVDGGRRGAQCLHECGTLPRHSEAGLGRDPLSHLRVSSGGCKMEHGLTQQRTSWVLTFLCLKFNGHQPPLGDQVAPLLARFKCPRLSFPVIRCDPTPTMQAGDHQGIEGGCRGHRAHRSRQHDPRGSCKCSEKMSSVHPGRRGSL